MIAYYGGRAYDVLSQRERWDAGTRRENRDRPGEAREAGTEKNKKTTTEASMSLKTKEGTSKTKLERTQNEPQLSAEMRALRLKFELSNTSHDLAGVLNRKDDRGRNLPRVAIQRAARKYENRGNEAKNYLKTKGITFSSAANYAYFARKFTAIWPQKGAKTGTFCKKKVGTCRSRLDAATVTNSRLDGATLSSQNL